LTVQHARRALLREAAYLIESGTPADAITALQVLVEPDAFRVILERADADNPKPEGEEDVWSHLAVILSSTLIKVARQWADLEPSTLTALEAMHRMVKTPRGGLSRRNRDSSPPMPSWPSPTAAGRVAATDIVLPSCMRQLWRCLFF
jgi:hypothetical protein